MLRSGYYVAITIIVVITVLITVYHDQIVKWIQPAANTIHKYVSFLPSPVLSRAESTCEVRGAVACRARSADLRHSHVLRLHSPLRFVWAS